MGKGDILDLRRNDVEIFKDGEASWIQNSVGRRVVWDKEKAMVSKPKTDAAVRALLLPLSVSD